MQLIDVRREDGRPLASRPQTIDFAYRLMNVSASIQMWPMRIRCIGNRGAWRTGSEELPDAPAENATIVFLE